MPHADAAAPATSRPDSSQPARRTIVKGAAWAVPALAIAAPASAAACSSPVSAIGCGNACQHAPNGSGRRFLHFVFCFTNTCDKDVTVTVGDVSVGGVVRDAMVNCQPPGSGPAGCPTFVVPAAGTHCKHVDAGRFPSDAVGPATLTWSYRDPASGNWVQGTPVGAGVTVGEDLPECAWPNPPHSRPDPTNCSVDIADHLGAVEKDEEPTMEHQAPQAPTVDEPASGADTESSTASPTG